LKRLSKWYGQISLRNEGFILTHHLKV
jgi:hypothetical protein